MKKMLAMWTIPALMFAVTACGGPETGDPVEEGTTADSGQFVKGGLDGKADASVVASFVDFKFSGQLITSSSYGLHRKVENQLLYTVGQLNGDNSVGRLDKLELSNVNIEETEDGGALISYDATLLVAWGDKENIPTEYTFKLPLDNRSEALDAFAEKYGTSCVDFGAHDVDAGSMWYYYRPAAYRCNLDSEDIVEVTASVALSEVNTTGKYPEYHKVWEDDVLRVVAVFGKYKDGATSSSDAGIAAYNDFVNTIQREFASNGITSEPAEVPRNPGVDMDDITFTIPLEGGRSIEVVTLMIDNVRTAGPEFDERYEGVSGKADLIAYNGHAGLGANIRALANKGQWETGQYAMVFMNGCDTYAYVDSALFDAHAAVNPNDPEGTKHLDLITNALPSYFSNMSESTMVFIRGLIDTEEPRTYEQIFRGISSSQVVLVSGEQDNEYVPGFGERDDEPTAWDGLNEDGQVEQGENVYFETPTLEAGTYIFTMTGDNDADLYVRAGATPTADIYDCRPYRAGSNETCVIELNSPAPIHVMVNGWARNSGFALEGRRD